jgi:NAD(P)-dependent dehydrogenase (short-subunit alcohol dehydrogenase family)
VPQTEPLIVVTGASRGIGRGIVDEALHAGWRVAAVDVDAAALAGLQGEHAGARLRTARLDVTDGAAVDAWLSTLVAEAGCPRALVNNAGIVRFAPLEELAVSDWRAVLDVNLTAAFTMTQRVGRLMLAEGVGSIVSIGSVAAVSPNSGGGAYAPSKAGLEMLMRGAALEWGARGVRANTVSPGYIRTPMTAELYADPERAAQRLSRVPAGRFGTPSDIAGVVLFLCSDAAAYISGQNIVVDGGVGTTTLMAAVPMR